MGLEKAFNRLFIIVKITEENKKFSHFLISQKNRVFLFHVFILL